MHHFKKMSSASGGSAPRPPPGRCPRSCWGTSVIQTHLEKNPVGAGWAKN